MDSFRANTEAVYDVRSLIGGSWVVRGDGITVPFRTSFDFYPAPVTLSPFTQTTGTVLLKPGWDWFLADDGSVFRMSKSGGMMDVPANFNNMISLASTGRAAVGLRKDGSVVLSDSTVLVTGLKNSATICANTLENSADGTAAILVLSKEGSLVWSNKSEWSLLLKGRSHIKKVAMHTRCALFEDGWLRSLVPRVDNGKRIFPELANVVDVVEPLDTLDDRLIALRTDGLPILLTTDLQIMLNSPPYRGAPPAPQPALTPQSHSPRTLYASRHLYLLADGGDFGRTLGDPVTASFFLFNSGSTALTNISFAITGPAASDFKITKGIVVPTVRGFENQFIDMTCTPGTAGIRRATLTITSDDPTFPRFDVPLLCEAGGPVEATSSKVADSAFTYGPLTLESQTGLITQKVIYRNKSRLGLPYGIRVELSNIAPGIIVEGGQPPQLNTLVFDPHPDLSKQFVRFTAPIQPFGTATFTICYIDPKRRVSASIQPKMVATPLERLEQRAVAPTTTEGLLTLRTLRVTAQGPWMEWDAIAGGLYNVEYSDDFGTTWYSATHVLQSRGTRMVWMDRGQPETYSMAYGRIYRVRKLEGKTS